jgi:hypothetical protein
MNEVAVIQCKLANTGDVQCADCHISGYSADGQDEVPKNYTGQCARLQWGR